MRPSLRSSFTSRIFANCFRILVRVIEVPLNVKEMVVSIKPTKSERKCKSSKVFGRSQREHIYMVIFYLRDFSISLVNFVFKLETTLANDIEI